MRDNFMMACDRCGLIFTCSYETFGCPKCGSKKIREIDNRPVMRYVPMLIMLVLLVFSILAGVSGR